MVADSRGGIVYRLPIRGDTHSVDVGKTYDYDSDDLFYYRLFCPLCRARLLVNGL